MRIYLRVLAAVAVLLTPQVHADELNVAVAANFLGTLQKLAPNFERASGHRLVPSSGSSGQVFAQIKQGAPFDVFLSADSERPRQLEADGLAVPGTRFTYATGRLVLWSPRLKLIDAAGKVLQGDRFRLIAVPDPRNAPYGTAAQQVLTAMGLWEGLRREQRIVIGETITQAWQFAASGNADMAFVGLSQVLGPDGKIAGSYWLAPDSMYARIDQDAVILAKSTRLAVTRAFTRWLRTSADALSRASIWRAGPKSCPIWSVCMTRSQSRSCT